MSRQPQSYVRYGSFVLFRKLEESSLGEIWRAAPINGNSTGPAVGLYRFTGGDTSALRRAAEQAAKNLGPIEGSTVVRKQTYHLVGKNPIITWDYSEGRSLFHMLEVARGGAELPSNPFPIDQALAIADKIALSLETTGNIKSGGQRLHHGALIPQLVWISEDGEVRTLGHQLTKGLLSAVNRPAVQQQFGGFIAPELKRNGESTEPSEAWAVGANLYAMLTGEFLPAPTDQAVIDTALSDAILATDEPIPEPVRQILAKSLAIDPARRYESPAALREGINSLTQEGEYAPTTFNLAFYIHNLLREEIEQEAAEREVEKGVDPSLVPPLGGEAGEPVSPASVEEEDGTVDSAAATPPFTAAELPSEAPNRSSRIPLIAAIVLMLFAGGAAAYWFTMGPGASTTPDSTVASAARDAVSDAAAPPPQREAPALESFVAVTDTGDPGSVIETITDTTTASPSEQELRQKLIQEQIDRRLQEEILKLQAEYDRKLREERDRRNREEPRQTTTSAPAKQPASPPQQQPVASKPSPAEELDRQQLESRETTAAAASPSVPADAGATDAATRPSTSTAAPVPAVPAAPTTKEGDLVDYAELDKAPSLTRRVEPRYPPLAARQKVEATIIVSALVSEAGKVLEVKILKGDPRRLGFEDAASEAIRKSTFAPGTKDGKRVKTWMPVPVIFKSQ